MTLIKYKNGNNEIVIVAINKRTLDYCAITLPSRRGSAAPTREFPCSLIA